MTILADANSPNTDGIHLAQSDQITIINSLIKTGDDCISIGPNNQNIWIQDISCGPGHGIRYYSFLLLSLILWIIYTSSVSK